MAMKENSKTVLNYLKSINGANVVAADVAEATGLEKRQVDGIFTAICRKGLGIRVPAEIEDEATGMHKQVKLFRLTDAGMAFDPDAEQE